jgi:polyhydroxybutyrate depolymerase
MMPMKRIFCIFLMGLAVAFSAAAQKPVPTSVKDSLRYKGADHIYWVYVPDSLSVDAPLLICLHGYGGSAGRGKGQLLDLAQEHGFALCAPQGLKDGRGKPCWNVGYPFQEGLKNDDVGFVEKLARTLVRKYGLNPANVFLTGMSNGGEMCYLMARKKPKLFAGIMSIAGLTLPNMEPLRYSNPVPFMEVHGTADKTSKWEGDPENKDGWGAYLSVPAAVSYVVAANGCRSYSKEELPVLRNPVILHKYLGGTPACNNGPACEVWFYEVTDGGHNWSDKDMDTYAEMWKFMDHFMRR